jgi:hypothetical protein
LVIRFPGALQDPSLGFTLLTKATAEEWCGYSQDKAFDNIV